jgi:hypothetical protein
MKRLGIYGCLLENYGPVLPCSPLGAMIVSGRWPLDKRDTVFVAFGSIALLSAEAASAYISAVPRKPT